MKHSNKTLEKFANSTFNSSEEKEFMDETMEKYYDQKLRKKYTSILENEHDLSQSIDNPKSKSKFGYSKLLLLLGSIAVLMVAIFFLSKSNQSVPQNYQVASNLDAYYTEIDFSTRGAVTDESTLIEIANLYEEKDFAKVSDKYSELQSLEIKGNYLHAIGVSLAKENQLEEAFKVWNILLETKESKYTYHNTARWFMGRAMIESGRNIEQGKSLLNDITEGSEFYEQAQMLVKAN